MRRLVICVALLLAACGSPAPTEKAAQDAVEKASLAWDDAFNQGDAKALADRYDEHAVSMPPGLATLSGREKIEADFATFFGSNKAEHHTHDADRRVSGDIAIERAQYDLTVTPRDGSAPTNESGKHIVVYHRQADGEWKVLWEIWNTPSR